MELMVMIILMFAFGFVGNIVVIAVLSIDFCSKSGRPKAVSWCKQKENWEVNANLRTGTGGH
jgi:hypothetical protein